MREIRAARSRSSPCFHAVAEDRREQDVLAALQRVGVDARERQQARSPSWRRARAAPLRRRATDSGGAAKDFRIETGSPAVRARRVDRELRGVLEPPDPRRRPAPSRRGPSSRARPAAPRSRRATFPCARVVLVDPRAEVRRREIRERQQQVAEVALRVDRRWRERRRSPPPRSATRQRPVLPLPVMPTHTACVTRSRES